MSYHIDASDISLNELKERILNTDLVPSRKPLIDGLADNIKKLHAIGIMNLEELREAVGTPKRSSALVEKSGVDQVFITLLKREINSYFPKPFPLTDFGVEPARVKNLEKEGIKNTAQLYDYLLAGDHDGWCELRSLCDLCRIQWVSPTASRMLYAAGCRTVDDVVCADPVELHAAFSELNKANRYFKGNIGLRDVRRLIHAASYLKAWSDKKGDAAL